jgi:hypothetical protein
MKMFLRGLEDGLGLGVVVFIVLVLWGLLGLLVAANGSGQCSRCKTESRSMKVSRCDGKETIRLCPKCQYEQDESFLKFCPVEEGE